MPWPRSGLEIPVASPPPESLFAETVITEEAAIVAAGAADLRVEMLVGEGARVAQGQPVLRLRHHPEIAMTAPMPAEVAEIDLAPGRRLSTIRFFFEPGAGRHEYDTRAGNGEAGALRVLLQAKGLWRHLRSRPFGRVPGAGEVPAAIVVMALDTRPGAPDPRDAIHDARDHLAAGLRALASLTEGPVLFCQDRSAAPVEDGPDRLRVIHSEPLHPWGLAGFHVHREVPATPAAPVWDIHAEDVAGIGALLGCGLVPETRLVSITGPAMTTARLVRCQPGADLRALTRAHVRPGPHRLLSGSAIGGREARWLSERDRQATVLPRETESRGPHWFLGALSRAARPMPLIPTAALEQALGGTVPAMPFLRALSVGDAEGFARLGGLSFVAEDLELADYVTGAEPRLAALLDGLLDRMSAEGIA